MEVRATSKYVRVQPRKVRIVADEIRGIAAERAVALLRYQPSKGARELRKTLVSAMANAQENHGLSASALRIATIQVDEGPRLKRIIAKAQGRAGRILKKTSHITVIVEEFEAAAKPKAHGTKAKPRPTLAVKSMKRRAAKGPEGGAPIEAEAQVETIAEPVDEATNTPAEAVAPAEEAVPGEEGGTD